MSPPEFRTIALELREPGFVEEKAEKAEQARQGADGPLPKFG